MIWAEFSLHPHDLFELVPAGASGSPDGHWRLDAPSAIHSTLNHVDPDAVVRLFVCSHCAIECAIVILAGVHVSQEVGR